jgi:hypothetical protein
MYLSEEEESLRKVALGLEVSCNVNSTAFAARLDTSALACLSKFVTGSNASPLVVSASAERYEKGRERRRKRKLLLVAFTGKGRERKTI